MYSNPNYIFNGNLLLMISVTYFTYIKFLNIKEIRTHFLIMDSMYKLYAYNL